MTVELIKEWKTKINLLYDDVKIYMDIIDNILKSNVEIFRNIASVIKKVTLINKFPKGDIEFKSSKDIFTHIDMIDTITSSLKDLIKTVTDLTHLKQIKSEMSDTYYKTITARGDRLIREINTLEELVVKITESILSSMDKEIVKNTPVSEFEKMYLSHLSSTSSNIFKFYIDTYRENHIDTHSLLQKIYDYILGYKDEILNNKPY